MKYPLLITLLLSGIYASAQLRLPGNNSFRTDFQKVVEDYSHGFSGIRGELISKNPQTIEYASRINPAGAEGSTITNYSSDGPEIYSWQALLLSTESFNEAEKKYKWLFSQLKGLNVKYVVDEYTLTGKYEKPSEEMGFVTSELRLSHPPAPLRKMTVEVSMQYEFPEWKVKLAVYEKEKVDTEKGDSMK